MVEGFLRWSFEPASEFCIGSFLKIHADEFRYHDECIKHVLYEFRVVPPRPWSLFWGF